MRRSRILSSGTDDSDRRGVGEQRLDAAPIGVAGLGHCFGKDKARKQEAIFDVSLCVHPGSLAALRGPSGSGKTAIWLAARPGIDASRLVVFGQSYGGFMVLAAITEHPEDWRAAAEFYGIADFRTLLDATGPWRRALRAVEYGCPDTEEGRALLARISPIRRIDRVRVPLFVAHGFEDPRVPPGESERVVSALRGRGRPVEIVRVEREGHGFARLESRRRVLGALARFLERETASASK